MSECAGPPRRALAYIAWTELQAYLLQHSKAEAINYSCKGVAVKDITCAEGQSLITSTDAAPPPPLS